MDDFNKNIQNISYNSGNSRRKIYRVQGGIMFLVSVGLLIMRLVVGYLPIENETLLDFLFSVPMQIGFLVIVPFLVYKFALKLKFRQIVSFSNIKKTKWYNIALMIPLAMCFFCITIGISGIWQTILMVLGYSHSVPPPLPATFSPLVFISSLFLTAVLPGFCEEFCNRGGFLSTMRGSFSFITTLVIMGLSFGMFHQNITQVFYTMFFGALAAFLTLKLNSVVPAMVMHFLNNGFSVFNEYCYSYGWLGGGFNAGIDWVAVHNPLIIFGGFIASCVLALVIIYVIFRLNKIKFSKNTPAPKIQIDVFDLSPQTKPATTFQEELFRPTLKDNAFYIGAMVAAILTTIFTFIFGII